MSVAPPRKKSRAVFWIAAIVIGSIILATALLANDMRNLRALDTRYQLNLFSQPAQPPPAPAAAVAAPQAANTTHPAPTPAATSAPAPAKPVKAVQAIQTTKPVHTRSSSHILDPPVDALRGAFVRSWRISGQALCADLTKSGLPVGEWKQSVLGVGTFECSHQIQKGDFGNPNAASFFIIARGTPTGDLDNIRIKVIMPDNADGRAVGETFIDAMVMLLTETHWLDFQAALDAIGKLQDVTQEHFGAKLSFFREFQNDRNFNLQLELRRTTPEQIRTAIVFDKARWTLRSAPPGN
ncbi:exopolysaccharide biosynthesis protein [Agrobacterium rhizogenes]|uniref:DUF6030 family protein n=1 Tax=Rhizobium rhizogenes TaxID=359 RepID=UPI001572CA29|nr:DUF6030 family protein [Rhizobium rhizogenes]NTG45889.1 exopolysaccharide biosynthesis protein [Rhizobium rhizogenes]